MSVACVWTAAAIFGQTAATNTRPVQLREKLGDNKMIVYFQGDEWTIDLATLPFLESDCPPEAEAFNRSVSPELSGCGHSPTVVGHALSPPRVFFTLWTNMVAQNVAHVLFEADAARHSVRRLLSAESGIGDLRVSPSGRYLAYAVGWSSGVCHHTSSVFVADRGVLSQGAGPAGVAGVNVVSPSMLAEPVRWATGDRLVFRESMFEGGDSCKAGPWRTKTVDVRSLRFH